MQIGWRVSAMSFEDRTADAITPLNRLIGISIGADRDRANLHNVGLAKVARSNSAAPGFGKQLCLEIQARREIVKGMSRPREAIDAAMLAAAIGVHRPIKWHVR